LDAFAFNAGATASDALAAGLPLVTLRPSPPAWPAACCKRWACLLVTHSLADYQTLALRLARQPCVLAALRTKLARNRTTYPRFDTDRFCRAREDACISADNPRTASPSSASASSKARHADFGSARNQTDAGSQPVFSPA
jgi:hypothetical protein